ncbi:MAG: cobalamin-dependent protein [Anaerolineae bacterium]|nr:cobalamin-dependent protein [Anaerolineae bacterium]
MADADIIYLHPAKHASDFRAHAEARSVSTYMLMPVGIPGILNLARQQGLRVVGLNVPLEAVIRPQFDLKSWLARQTGASLIAIDLHWYEHSFGALDVARVCKEIHPQVPVVLGGLTASHFAKEILRDFPEVDFVIRGDGELPFLELALALRDGNKARLAAVPNLSYRQGERILENPQRYCATTEDLNRLDFVDMAWLEHTKEYATVEVTTTELLTPAEASTVRGHWLTIGRGCCFNCSFCGGGQQAHATLAGRNGIVSRSPSHVVDDIERMLALGMKQVSFNLDPAIMGRPYWTGLFGEMRRRKIRIGVYNEQFQLPSDEFLNTLLEVAEPRYSELAITPLSGSEEVRALNGKNFTNKRLFDVLARLKPHQMPVYLFFSLNVPGENNVTFKKTLRLARDACQLYPPHLLRMINMVHTVDPCSPISRDPAGHRLKVEFKTFADYYTYCRETPVLREDVPLEAWRGYEPLNKATRSLEQMARQWDDFCAEQAARCYPVPRTW